MSPKNNRPISSGPFVFNRWQRGSQLVLTRNPNYWGKKAYLNQIVYRVVADTNTQFQAIRSGELSVLRPQPQLQIADARRNNNLRVQFGPEFSWEHIDMQQGPKGHPALRQKFVRQALIRGINRSAITSALYRTISPGLPVLQNVIFKPFESQYKPNWRKYTYNRAAAEQLLRSEPLHEGLGRDLQLPERRQAVVPLHLDRRQPAPRAHLRGDPVAAEGRRHRGEVDVRPGEPRVRHGAAVA